MELLFETKNMKYLCRILRETKCWEETLETIVPDSFPDVDRVLCGNAVAAVRSKECHAGSVTVSGGIRANAIYAVSDEKLPRCLEMYMPFSTKVESPKLTEKSQVVLSVSVRSVDVRTVNSRKIVVRVNLCAMLCAYEACEQALYTMQECPENVQTCVESYPMLLPAETAERSFQISEDLSLPVSRPLTGMVYQFSPRLEITEQRLAGDKAVFKGLLHYRILYGTNDDTMTIHEGEVPFSQYCELTNLYEEEHLQLTLALTGCELDRAMQQDGEGLHMTLHILAQCVVMKTEPVEMIKDAYCITGDFLPQWEKLAFDNRLDRQVLTHTVRDSQNASVSDVVEAWVTMDLPHCQQMGGEATVSVPTCINVLYLDMNGQYQFMSFRSEFKESFPLAENASCWAMVELAGDVVSVPAGSGVELRYPVNVVVESFASNEYRTLCGGEIKETEGHPKRRPAVIARRMRSGETLWDIAKATRTSVEKIRKANHLDDDPVETSILLIPT